MDSQKNPNLETTHNNDHHLHHHHVLPSPSSSSQDFKRTHHQHNIHVSKKTYEDEGLIFKNAYEVIKKSNSHYSSSLAAGEEYTMPPPPPPPSPQDFKKSHHQHNIHVSKKTNENEGFTIKNANYEVIKKPNSLSSLAAGEVDMTTPTPPTDVAVVEESGRDKLKRHRIEMAGRVWIPDIWGHEDLLKDWIDCTVFDSSLGNNTIISARAALVQEGRSTLRLENRC